MISCKHIAFIDSYCIYTLFFIDLPFGKNDKSSKKATANEEQWETAVVTPGGESVVDDRLRTSVCSFLNFTGANSLIKANFTSKFEISTFFNSLASTQYGGFVTSSLLTFYVACQ